MEIRLKTADEFRDAHVTIEIRAANQNEAQRVLDGALSCQLYTAEQVGDFQASEAELVSAPLRRQLNEALTRARKAEAEVERQRSRAHAFNLDRETENERADQNKAWAERAEARLAKDAEAHVRRVAELERGLEYWRDQYDDREKARASLELRVAELERTMADYDRARIDLNEKMAVHGKDVARRLAERQTELAEMTTQRDQLLSQLHGPDGPHAKLIEAQEGIKVLAAQIGKVSGAVHGPEIAMALDKGEEWPGDHLTTLATAVREVRRVLGTPEPGTSQA